MPHWIENNTRDILDSNVFENSERKWKDLQPDDDGREPVEIW